MQFFILIFRQRKVSHCGSFLVSESHEYESIADYNVYLQLFGSTVRKDNASANANESAPQGSIK